MRSRRGIALISRPRLQERLAARRICVLEAPGGYGKSTAWSQLALALDLTTIRVVLRRPQNAVGLLASIALGARRAGLSALADAIDVDSPEDTLDQFVARLEATDRRCLIAVDEVHHADPQAGAWLAALARDLPERARLVVSGRRVGPVLGALGQRPDVAYVAVPDLRFDAEDVRAVFAAAERPLVADEEVEQILVATDGWPAAVALAATSDIDVDWQAPAGGRAHGAVLRRLINGLLSTATPATRQLVEHICVLPLLSGPVAAAVGGDGALDRLLNAGLPIRFRPDGWAELPDPVRELFPSRAIPHDVARNVARLYAQGGELAEAAALLHRAGDLAGVIELLGGERREVLQAAGLAFFEAVLVDATDEMLRSHPTALVQLIRASERQPRLRRTWIERATTVFAPGTPPRRAVDAERSLDVARAGELETAKGICADVLASAGPDEIVTRARAHFAHALCDLILDTAGITSELVDELELAIGLFALAGERSWEAEAHLTLGYGVLFTSGAVDLASQRLDRTLALQSAPDAARAVTLTYVAEVLMQLDRFDDAAVALRESSVIGHRLGDAKSIAYAAWSTASLACRRRDPATAFAALEEAETHPEGWFERLAGVEFLSTAAEIRTILGDESGARRDLARAEARGIGTARAPAPLAARARLEVTFGDPQAALRALDELDVSTVAYVVDRWLRLLLRAACMARLGDRQGAAAMAARAREAAIADFGDPDRLARREPELMAIALPGEETMDAPSSTTIVLLGRFAVERNGVDVSPAAGNPATLVKLIALQGSLTADEAIDVLWPDSDFDTGRGRLRNLLSRIRSMSGDLIERKGNSLVLAADVSVDASKFEEEAAVALRAHPEERAGIARRALTRSTGELLPGDRYADWSVVPRERVRRRHLALVDLVAEDAITRGDLDEADRLLDTAITADPLEEIRYVRLARALLAQGRIRRARRVADQGAAIAADLGTEPGEELALLLTQLRTRAREYQA